MTDIERIAAGVRAAPARHGIRLVGVDGGSGSGKSTVAARLAAALDAPLVPTDDFASWTCFADWWPRLEQQVLAPLLAGSDARYQQRDWVGDEFGDGLGAWRTVAWAPVVVVEGVTSTRRAVAGRLAYRIWVETPEPIRFSRGIARDGESHRGLWETWLAQEREFFAADDPVSRADLVLDGTAALT